MSFYGITDQALIDELVSRGRVRVVENSTGYFSELLHDDRYMASIDSDMVRGIVRELDNKLWIKTDDVVTAWDALYRPIRATRKATVTIIVPEGVEDGD